MQYGIEIRAVTARDDPALEKVKTLFGAMYAFMKGTGLQLGLPEEGASKWMRSAIQGLGRFGALCIAASGEDIIGFAHGSIRLTPDYLGSRKVGVITHIYVVEEYRGDGVGKKLVEELEKWFREKEVHSVELQVLAGNKAGIAFWEKLGYPAELQQHRKGGEEI